LERGDWVARQVILRADKLIMPKGLLATFAGHATIEFAFIVPILLLMLAGVVEIGRLYQVWNVTNRLASQYAIVYADCLGSTNAISNIAPQLRTSLLSATIFQVSMSGTTPTVEYAFPSGATLTASQVTAAQGVLSNGQVGIVVTATNNHTLQFFQAMMTPYLGSVLTASYTAVQLKG
jgi:Flp pilus assembly protein TadG